MIDENEETSLHHLQSPEGNIENFINKIALNTNQLFFKYHLLNKKVVFLFLQLKIHELTERLQLYEKWESKV